MGDICVDFQATGGSGYCKGYEPTVASRGPDVLSEEAKTVVSAFSQTTEADRGFPLPPARSLLLAQVDQEGLRPVKMFVAKFTAQGVEDELAQKVAEMVSTRLSQWQGVEAQSFQDISGRMGLERMRQLCGGDTESCSADVLSEIAGALGVDFLVTGSVGLLGEAYVVNIQLVDDRMRSAPFRGQFNILRSEESRLIVETARAVDGLVSELTETITENRQSFSIFQVPEEPTIVVEELISSPPYQALMWTSAVLAVGAMVVGGIGANIASKNRLDHKNLVDSILEEGGIVGDSGNYEFTNNESMSAYRGRLTALEDKITEGNIMTILGFAGGAALLMTAGLFLWLDQTEETEETEESGEENEPAPVENAYQLGIQPLEGGMNLTFGMKF